MCETKRVVEKDDCAYSNQVNPPTLNMDAWSHRSSGMKCATCMWFVIKKQDTLGGIPVLGRCRRHAPTMNGYPAVYAYDWCGDHKLDENKI
jgi:hypothetical protein